jgi:DNA polymerase alpha subunit A
LSGDSDFFSQEFGFMSGRLLCDTFVASKDLIKAKAYNLTELSKSQFNILRQDIKPDQVRQFYRDSDSILDIIAHCSFDAYLSLKLMFKLQILPLTKQLTNLSGNKWSKSMYGARSDRNEHLLLHTFYKQGYVYPNKHAHYATRNETIPSKIETGNVVIFFYVI